MIGSDEGRMRKLILDDDVGATGLQPGPKVEAKAARQPAAVRSAREGDNGDVEVMTPEIVDNQAVVQVAAGELFERTIEDPADANHRSWWNEAHAVGLSHNLTVCDVNRVCSSTVARRVARTRAKFSRLGFKPANSGRSLRVRPR